jgi:small redox-active disulfide protein 2
MREIKILGTGCAKCTKLYEMVDRLCVELGLDYRMEKVSDVNEIISFGIMMTPGLVIDGVVKCSGKLPNTEDVRKWLETP